MALSKLLNFSEPQFYHLQNEKNYTYLLAF